jgi:hypothetical protein
LNTFQVNDLLVLKSSLGNISGESIKDEVNTFINTLQYFINNFLRIHPIPLPIIKGIDLDNFKLTILSDSLLSITCKPQLN